MEKGHLIDSFQQKGYPWFLISKRTSHKHQTPGRNFSLKNLLCGKFSPYLMVIISRYVYLTNEIKAKIVTGQFL